MPRIRSIKPDFFLDDEITLLPAQIQLAFIGLWCHADKSGRLEDKPRHLKAVIFPYTEIDMESTLERLANHPKTEGQPFITRYSMNGHKYIQVNSFYKHQRPHHTEKASIIPLNTPIDNRLLPVTPQINQEGKEAVLKEAVLKEAVLKEEGTVIGKGKRKRREYPADFDLFWKIHPKGGKDAAYKAMEKFLPDEEELNRWAKKLEVYKQTAKWKEGISPNMSTWINQGYFDGEVSSGGPQSVMDTLNGP